MPPSVAANYKPLQFLTDAKGDTLGSMLKLTKSGDRVHVVGVSGQHKAAIWLEPVAGGKTGVRVQNARNLMHVVELVSATRMALQQHNGGTPADYWQTVLAILEKQKPR